MASSMRVERAEPIRNQVVRSLREAITDLRLKPGQVLVERELCEMTGASRPSVREALRLLESEGLVSSRVGKGTVVTTVTREEARQLYEVRAVLEGLAGRLFTVHADVDALTELTATVDRFEAELDRPEKLLAVKNDFYRILFAGAGNGIADTMASTLQRRTSMLRATSLSADGRPGETLVELRAILAAMRRRDEVAVEALCRAHVERAQEAALRQLPE